MSKINSSSLGKYSFTVNRSDGSVESFEFRNLILNTALDSSSGNNMYVMNTISSIALGTGTTPASITDTALDSFLAIGATTEVVTNQVYLGKFESERVATVKFAAGAVIGTVTEVGCRNGNGVYMSRSLLSDIAGNPTSLTLGEFDQLTVVYTRVVQIDSFDFTTIININGTDVGCRVTSVNPENNSYPNIFHNYPRGCKILTESITPPSEGGAFDESIYSTVAIENADTTANVLNSMHFEHEIIMQPADYILDIYGISYSHFSGAGETIVLSFNTPITKTSADKITISLSMDLVGIRV